MTKHEPTSTRRICHPGPESDKIKIDREFEGMIPPLSSSELADLHKSLNDEGCRDALTVWKSHNTLVDGHNRIKYCRANGLPYPVVEKEFADRAEVKAYITSVQLGRRNLSPAAESYLRGKRYLETKHQGKRGNTTSGQSDQKSSSQRLGEEFKVGEKTIRRDAKFAEAVDSIAELCGAETKNLILSRDYGLTRGNVIRLSRLTKNEQKAYLEELKETGKRPRKPRSKGKRRSITLPFRPKALVAALLSHLGQEEIAEVSKALADAIANPNKDVAEGEKNGQPKKRKAKAK